MKRSRYCLAVLTVLFMALGPSAVQAGTSQNRVTEDWGVQISWRNPSAKPTGYQNMKVKFKFTNNAENIKYFNVLHTSLLDANGMEVADEISIGNIQQGKSGYVTLSIYGDDLKGSKAPYTVAFEFNGISISPYTNVSEYSEFPFVFEVPSTITCVKKGKPNKKITAYKPKCPVGYTKR